MSKYNTIQQHEPLRVPQGWNEQERKLISQLEEILDDLYRRFNRLRLEDLGKDLRQTIIQDGNDLSEVKQTAQELSAYVGNLDGELTTVSQKADGLEVSVGALQEDLSEVSGAADDLESEVGKIKDGTTAVKTLENTKVSVNTDGVQVKTGGAMTVKAGAGFTVETDADFTVYSQNMDVDENGLLVKSGTIKGDHFTTDGYRVLSESDVVIGSSTPEAADGRIWVKPLDSVTVNYSKAITQRTNIIGYSGTLNTSGAASGSGGTYSYTLRIPYHAGTSSGTGGTISVNVGGLVFSGTINKGYYSNASTYVSDFTFEKTITSSTWLGTNTSLSISISGSAPGNTDKYKINVGQITLTAKSAGSSGAGWKACEIKVYQG